MQFILKTLSNKHIRHDISSIGFDENYLDTATLKHDFLSVKIFELSPKQATILKQTALSNDCDCAIHRCVLDYSIDKSYFILSGTLKLLLDVAESLKKQPFELE